MAMNSTALTSGEPTRLTALLIAEPRPAFFTGTELISAVVSGATSMLIPTPKTSDARADVDERRGRRDQRSPDPPDRRATAPSRPGCAPARGARRHDSGPTVMNSRGPKRAESWPTGVERKVSSSAIGMPPPRRPAASSRASPAGRRLEGEGHVQRAVDDERRQVDDREVARREQARRHERPRRVSIRIGTASVASAPMPSATQGDGSCQPRSCAARGAEREPADTDGDDGRSEPVEVAAALRCRGSPGHRAARPQRDRDERHVDRNAARQLTAWTRKPPSSGPMIDGGRRAGCPQADGAAARLALEGGGDDREAARDQQGPEGRLDDARRR